MLAEIVASARDLGFVGSAPVARAIEHARGFAAGVPHAPRRLLDLGSGGGLPGLVLASEWPEADIALVDANRRRCAFLEDAVDRLGFGDRVRVVAARAEDLGRSPLFRASFDLVTARGFGRPAVTAECAAPLLATGGRLIVSEPPDVDADRWPARGVALLGLELGPVWTEPYHYRALIQASLCPERYPRRVGVPAKRPLF